MASDRSKGSGRVRLEVIAHTFEGMGICTACEVVMAEARLGQRPTERALDEYPLEWQEECFFKSLRYRVRRYPTWVVDGKTRVVGWDREALDAALSRP
jgi:hypothetical protein